MFCMLCLLSSASPVGFSAWSEFGFVFGMGGSPAVEDGMGWVLRGFFRSGSWDVLSGFGLFLASFVVVVRLCSGRRVGFACARAAHQIVIPGGPVIIGLG